MRVLSPPVHPVDGARSTRSLEPLQMSGTHCQHDLLHAALNVDARELVVREVRSEGGAKLEAHGAARDAAQHLADGDGT